MAVQQIKAYVEVQSPAQLTQFKGVSSEVVVRAYQLNWRLRENIGNLLAALAGQRGPYLITGQKGVGKSHLLTLIRALTSSPGLSNALKDPTIVSAAGKLADEHFFSIEIDITSEDPPDLLTMLREELATRESNPLVFSDAEWESNSSDARIFRLIKSKLRAGTILVLLIDGLSLPMRTNRSTQNQIVNWLARISDHFRDQFQSLIITLDDDVLSEVVDELLPKFKVEKIHPSNLRDIADRFILKKNDQQRQEIGHLYSEIVRLMPQFCWSRDDFIALFPIHPSVLEVSSGVRNYSKSFSLLGFIGSSASKATNRRGLNLSALDELFDSFEFDLRKDDKLEGIFAAYDLIIQTGIPKLAGFDEKMWAKLALKALFLFSLANKPVTSGKLADSVMLYDDRDFSVAIRRINAIVECFVKTVPELLEVQGEGRNATYRFLVKPLRTPQDILLEYIERIADTDNGLGEILVTVGGSFFSDWTFKLGENLRTEISVTWRNTVRQGILKVGTEVELFPINTNITSNPLASVSVGVDLLTPDLSDDEELLPIDLLVEAAQTGEYQLNPTICEWDWQVCLIPLNYEVGIDIPFFNPPTLVYWIPDKPTREDVIVLKQALVLRLEREQLVQEKINCIQEQEKIDLKVQEIFQRLYIDNGKFINPGSERPILIFQSVVAGSTVAEMFSLLLAESFLIRYPEHPNFGVVLTEQEIETLARNLFAKVDPYSAITQAYAENYALPLKLVSNETGQYEVKIEDENLPAAVTEILKALNDSESGSVSIAHLNARLRNEPFGLKILPQKLILLALVSQWRIELTSDLSSDVLTAATLATEEDLGQFTHLRIPLSLTYPPKVLQDWFCLLTAQETTIDLIDPSSREQIRESLKVWQENWLNLAIADRLERLPVDGVTTRLWQMVISCRRYFDAASNAVTDLINEHTRVETALCQIVDSFGGKDTVYFHAVNELTMLINFLEWLPFFLETKDYILSAETTSDSQIEAERNELVAFLDQSQRLFDEEKRQRYETVYKSFQSHYTDFYSALHDNLMSPNQITELEEILNSDKWRAFELISQLNIASQGYYLTALELIKNIKSSVCQLPLRELLQTQSSCNCSFRINHKVDTKISLETLKNLIDQAILYHQQLLTQYRVRLRSLSNVEEEELKKLELLFSSFFNGESRKLTIYSVEKLNQVLDTTLKSPIGLMPAIKLNNKMNKQDLKDKFERWLESLPEEPGLSLEFSNRRDLIDE